MTYKKAFKTENGRASVISVYDKILNNWKVAFETFTINSTYGETFIIKSGHSTLPPLILLHGTSSNSAMWVADVEEYTKHYCVYAIDIPGEPGKSEERQYSLDSSAYFEWFNELVMHLKFSTVSVIGISLGAWLAVGYSIRYPQKVEKLVLLCPSGIGRQKISFIFKAMPLMLFGDWGFKKIARFVNGNQSMPKEAEDYTILIAKNFNLRTQPVPIYTDNELRQLKMRILLFVGEKDVLLNSRETLSRVSSLLPHTTVNLLTESGHVLIGLKYEILNFLQNKTP